MSRSHRDELPAELEVVVQRAVTYVDELAAEHANEPSMAGLDLFVGWAPSRPWRQRRTRWMSAFLARYGDATMPTVLMHSEPLVSKAGWRQPWQLVQTAEAARDKMARVLTDWQQGDAS